MRLMEFAWPFEHSRTIPLLQSAYGEYQIGTLENFHQLVEDALIVLRPRLKVFFQYELRFANRLESQLLISHRFLPIKIANAGEWRGGRNQAAFGDYFGFSINYCFRMEP
jgi:hypothetical protein